MNLPPKPHYLGILNLTPDSFSDGGRFNRVEAALARAEQLLGEGANALDLGAESTRPGAAPISEAEELERLLPVLKALHERWPNLALSVDTRKAAVAQAALEAGASLLNDVSGLSFDPGYWEVLKQAPPSTRFILMHSLGTPETMQALAPTAYSEAEGGVLGQVERFFKQRLEALEAMGFSRQRVLLDPGFGFGKTVEQNLALLQGLKRLTQWGCPVLVGLSRKSFLAQLAAAKTGHSELPPIQREALTAMAQAYAWQQGATWFRVHEVGQQVAALALHGVFSAEALEKRALAKAAD